MRTEALVSGTPEKIYTLPVDSLRPSPFQPRRAFPEEGLRDLAESVRVSGLLSPVLVRPCVGGYELIAGERRLRAVKLLGQRQIPALIVPASDREAAAMAMLENLQRESLHFLEEAEGYRRLTEELGFSQTELAQRLGRAQSSVANRLRLLKLPESVRARILESEAVGERHARALIGLDEKSQLQLTARIQAERLTVRQTESAARMLLSGAERKKPPRIYLRDGKIAINALEGAVDRLREAGIEAQSRLEAREGGAEFIVSLPSWVLGPRDRAHPKVLGREEQKRQ